MARIGNTISYWKSPKSGIPRDTKLGVIWFIIMTNGNFRIKFVDDTTAFETIPRDSFSLLQFATNDFYSFSEEPRMKLNPIKCREMIVNFMTNHNFIINPVSIGGNTIERVVVYKLLGV